MKKAIEILKGAATYSDVEARMWKKQGRDDVVRICKREKKEILEALKILKEKNNERTAKTSGRQPL